MASVAAPTGQARGREAGPERRPALAPFLLLPGPLGWLLFFYVVPLTLLLVHAFWSVDYLTIDRTPTLANFKTFFTNSLYPTVLWRTIVMAVMVTLTDIIIAFPLAYFLARRVRRNRELLLMLVVFPLWASYLVRVFAWRTILGTNGILNSFLIWANIVDEPVSAFLFSRTAMFLAFTQVWLPFMILPLYTILERLPSSLLEASADLGGNGLRTFLRVILPLSLPGILAGSLSVFSLTMGDYITPTLLGGPGDQLIGKIVADNFGVAYNWPLGATLVIPLLLVISLFLWVANRAGATGRSAA